MTSTNLFIMLQRFAFRDLYSQTMGSIRRWKKYHEVKTIPCGAISTKSCWQESIEVIVRKIPAYFILDKRDVLEVVTKCKRRHRHTYSCRRFIIPSVAGIVPFNLLLLRHLGVTNRYPFEEIQNHRPSSLLASVCHLLTVLIVFHDINK
mgnify:CR=1 FL=1